MWYLQSYPTTVLNERMWHFMVVKTYSGPSYIFSGGQSPNPYDLRPCPKEEPLRIRCNNNQCCCGRGKSLFSWTILQGFVLVLDAWVLDNSTRQSCSDVGKISTAKLTERTVASIHYKVWCGWGWGVRARVPKNVKCKCSNCQAPRASG